MTIAAPCYFHFAIKCQWPDTLGPSIYSFNVGNIYISVSQYQSQFLESVSDLKTHTEHRESGGSGSEVHCVLDL